MSSQPQRSVQRKGAELESPSWYHLSEPGASAGVRAPEAGQCSATRPSGHLEAAPRPSLCPAARVPMRSSLCACCLGPSSATKPQDVVARTARPVEHSFPEAFAAKPQMGQILCCLCSPFTMQSFKATRGRGKNPLLPNDSSFSQKGTRGNYKAARPGWGQLTSCPGHGCLHPERKSET